MKRITIAAFSLLFMVLMGCSPAFSQTYFSSCPGSGSPISTPGSYILTADLASSSDCIVVTGQNQDPALYGYTDLYCNGHSITMTSFAKAVNAHANAGTLYMHGCVLNGTQPGHQLFYVDHSGTGTNGSTISIGNTYNNGNQWVSDSPHFYSYYDTMNDAVYQLQGGADYFSAYGFTSTASPSSSGYTIAAVFIVNNSSHVSITHGTINADSTSVDDGILVASVPGSGYISTDLLVDHVTINDAGDAAIETAGEVTYLTVSNNTLNRSHYGAFTCYHSCSFDHVSVTGNTATSGANGSKLVQLSVYPPTGTYLTNNTFSGNTFSKGSFSPAGSEFGNAYGNTFATTGSNTLTGNVFDGPVFLNDTTGFVDGGSNYCTASFPTGNQITCNH